MSIQNRYFSVQSPWNQEQQSMRRKSVLLQNDQNTQASESTIFLQNDSTHLSKFQRSSQESIGPMVKQKMMMFQECNQNIDNQYLRFTEFIRERDITDIIFENEELSTQKKRQKMNVLKATLKNVLSFEEQDLNCQRLTFLKKNSQLEELISQQMGNLEALDQELNRNFDIQERAINNYEKEEYALKQMLLQRAEIQDIQEKQQIVKTKIVAVRKIREIIQSLKDKKVDKIQMIIKDLQSLNQHRTGIIYKIDKKYFQISDFNSQINILQKFIEEINELQYLKQENQSQKKILKKSNYKEEIKTKRNSYSNIQRQQNQNNSSRSIKAVHMLESSPSPSPFSVAHDQPQEGIQQIMSNYRQILDAIIKTESQQNEFLQNKMKKCERTCSIEILERKYFDGILQISPSIRPHEYFRFLNQIVTKCMKYIKVMQIKLKEKQVLSEKIRNISQTERIFCENIKKIRQETQDKASVYEEIQNLLTSLIQEDKSTKTKNTEKQIQKLQMKRAIYEKQLEQYAETANIRGYKQTKTKIIQNIQQLEKSKKQLKISGNISQKQGEYYSKVEKILFKFGYSYLAQRIKGRNPAKTLTKAKKRLMPI